MTSAIIRINRNSSTNFNARMWALQEAARKSEEERRRNLEMAASFAATQKRDIEIAFEQWCNFLSDEGKEDYFLEKAYDWYAACLTNLERVKVLVEPQLESVNNFSCNAPYAFQRMGEDYFKNGYAVNVDPGYIGATDKPWNRFFVPENWNEKAIIFGCISHSFYGPREWWAVEYKANTMSNLKKYHMPENKLVAGKLVEVVEDNIEIPFLQMKYVFWK